MLDRVKKLLLISLLMLLLPGCWDYEDINMRSITLSTGIDEEDGKIVFMGELAKLTSGSSKGGSSASTPDVYFFSAEGKTFEETRNDFFNKTPLTNFQGAMRSIAFCQEYARKEGIESYINRFSYIHGFRDSTLVVISDEHINKLFDSKIINDLSIGHAINNTIRYLEKDGKALYTTVQSIKQNLAFKEIGFLIPCIKKEEGSIKYLGLGVIKNSKLIGIIKASESTGTLLLTNKKASFSKAIPDPKDKNNLISINTTLKKRKIKTNYDDGKVYINIKLDISSELVYEYKTEPISDKTIKELESKIAAMVKEEVVSSINRSKEEFESDIYGFARYFKADNPNIFKSIDWIEEYPKAHFNVEVNSKIVNYNLVNPKFKKIYKGGAK